MRNSKVLAAFSWCGALGRICAVSSHRNGEVINKLESTEETPLNLSKMGKIHLDNMDSMTYNIQADMALNASWIKPDAIGGRENNV